jgi:crossover junction endodeoxyribonuclease RusA
MARGRTDVRAGDERNGDRPIQASSPAPGHTTAAFTIPGRGQPKQRPGSSDRRRTRYNPGRTRGYQESVGWAAKVAHVKPIPRPHRVAVTLTFFGAAGDVDNLAKSVLDGLNTIAYDDDSQIDELHVFRIRSVENPRCEVLIERIEALVEVTPP